MSVRVQDVIDALEDFAPLPLQESYDNAGLQVGLTEAEVSGALLCLDVTEGVIQEALELGCNMIVSHHPLILRKGIFKIEPVGRVGKVICKALENKMVLYSMHTNLDSAEGGLNDAFAAKLGLSNVTVLSSPGTREK